MFRSKTAAARWSRTGLLDRSGGGEWNVLLHLEADGRTQLQAARHHRSWGKVAALGPGIPSFSPPLHRPLALPRFRERREGEEGASGRRTIGRRGRAEREREEWELWRTVKTKEPHTAPQLLKLVGRYMYVCTMYSVPECEFGRSSVLTVSLQAHRGPTNSCHDTGAD